jgi:hypothetical protein
MRGTLIVVGLLLAGAELVGAGIDGLVAVGEVPAAARRAADEAVPGTTWLLAFKDGSGWYKLVGKNKPGRLVECLTDPEGKELVVRIEVPREEVPAAVLAALQNRMPNCNPKSIQACGLTARNITVYRFQFEGLEGGNAGLYISASGMKVTEVKK